jgi:hypothetical protein
MQLHGNVLVALCFGSTSVALLTDRLVELMVVPILVHLVTRTPRRILGVQKTS